MANLRPRTEDKNESLGRIEERREEEGLNMEKINAQKDWFNEMEKNLKSEDITLADLEDDSLWSKAEKKIDFDEEKFREQSPTERRLDYEREIFANDFKEKRISEIARRRLDEKVDEILAAPPTLEEKMAKLTPEQHKKLFEKLMG